MSDFSDVYGLLFIGLVIVLLFITCYKLVQSNDSLIKNALLSDYLASKYKDELMEYDSMIIYNKTFVLPRFNPLKNEIGRVVSYE